MFLHDRYILASEVSTLAGFSYNVMSMCADENNSIKLGGTLFIDRESQDLPGNIRAIIKKHEGDFTSLSGKLPLPHIKSEWNISKRDISKLDIVEGMVDVNGKEFVKFKEDFVKRVRKKEFYPLGLNEANELCRVGDIDFYIQISKTRAIGFY